MAKVISLFVGVILAGCAVAETSAVRSIDVLKQAFEDVGDGPILVVAHRGCWSAAPENSVAAMQACIDLGVDAVEIDVRLTRDGKPIVFHDGNLHRMTEQWGYVSEWTLDDLRKLSLLERDVSASYLYSKRLSTHHKIATLEEVLEACRGNLLINLEIKTDSAWGFREVFDEAVAVTKSLGMEDHVFWKIPPAGRSHKANREADEIYSSVDTSGLPYVMPIIWESARGLDNQLSDFNDDSIVGFEGY